MLWRPAFEHITVTLHYSVDGIPYCLSWLMITATDNYMIIVTTQSLMLRTICISVPGLGLVMSSLQNCIHLVTVNKFLSINGMSLIANYRSR